MKSKKKTTAIILCCGAFIGLGGLHDFYLGKNVMGVIKLLTLNFLWIGAILDLIKLKNGTYYDFKATSSSGTLVDIDPERISDEGICWKVRN